MKKALKIGGILLLVGIAAFFYLRKSQGMEMPTGSPGTEAEALAQKMMDACNASAWENTRFITWDFAGRNSYVWDRSEGKVEVVSGESRAVIYTSTQEGLAWDSEKELSGGEKKEALDKAWANFCNDSFWLIAPLKVMDPGTTRELVQTEEGKGLMVHYNSGGVTPGDSYLWYIAEDGLPYAYRMWTQVLPIPGMRSTWEEWKTVHSGAKIATKRSMSSFDLIMGNLRSGSTLAEIGLKEDHFE
ncbi:MAG: hypothetical protein HKN45_01975 [Flavobacteriales bacterium]|nr:hypothetical protein [Flavobacteriales bacterium]